MADSRLVEGRRPLKSRDVAIFKKLAASLAKAGVSPDLISFISIIFAALTCAAFVVTSCDKAADYRSILWIIAAGGIQLRLLCNLLDGMVAVEGGKGGIFGNLWNEIPDRFADIFILAGAGFAFASGAWLGFTAAIIAVMTAYIRAIGASLGAGQDYSGPQGKQHRMAVMSLACVLLAIFPEYPEIIRIALWFVIIGGLVTIWRRVKNICVFLKTKNS